jgi:hypothetical protein
MSKFIFDANALKRGIAIARLVKPETNDFSFQFFERFAVIFSYNKRSYVKSIVQYSQQSDVEPDYRSEEFYITTDRIALFDTDLDKIIITVNDKNLKIRVEGDGTNRMVSLKPRALKARRPKIPDFPADLDLYEVQSKSFDHLLKQLSCSALIRETKTEDDMRINQIHFYSDYGCAVSIARFYATIASMNGLNFDLSIISSDLPVIRSFCSKATSETVQLCHDAARLYMIDPATQSIIAFSKVTCNKPSYESMPETDYQHSISLNGESLKKCLSWVSLAMDGTQRLSFLVQKNDDNGGELEIRNGTEEISRLECQIMRGGNFEADFPVKHFVSILGYLDNDITLEYQHKELPALACIRESNLDLGIKARHYITSMVRR